MKLAKIKILNTKKAEGVFGMSFGMIFSIILIVFFFAAAFLGIRTFLNWQKCAQIGMFFDDIQNRVDEAWNSPSASYRFNATLPTSIKNVCLINITGNTVNANNIEKAIFNYLKTGYLDPTKNFYLYAPEANLCMNWKNLKHISYANKNPQCFSVINGLVSIKIERKFEDTFPSLL